LLGDGIDVWQTLSTGAPSPRDWLLLETHPVDATPQSRVHGDAIIIGDMKIYKRGPDFAQVENGWFPPPGQDPKTTKYSLSCGAPQPAQQPSKQACVDKFCLWNVTADPCEYFDLADKYPDIVSALVQRLNKFMLTAVPLETGSGCETKKVPAGDNYSFVPCDWNSSVRE
jgi:hypothetical protein